MLIFSSILRWTLPSSESISTQDSSVSGNDSSLEFEQVLPVTALLSSKISGVLGVNSCCHVVAFKSLTRFHRCLQSGVVWLARYERFSTALEMTSALRLDSKALSES
ncbi:hypothetical protein OGAPHI_001361 [Ogataea philodendri]|uniref:Uncharacterized protein n=1 Tax=Ogataea philodendri TaxID=1378263 RepID=A0A9P8PCM9_9ASCO|nr:uncharacterized protein OGAPHI_001361 [Ogataea philodendri]KAH3669240.1 hypothetical protein OGAPHI_001361 [Ogataea philodendri]